MLGGGFKVDSMLLGQQKGFTKFPCFICQWDSRARGQRLSKKQWHVRKMLTSGKKNILHNTLVDPKKILLLPLHIKLGLIKQFVKALPKDGDSFKYLFPHLSEAKLTILTFFKMVVQEVDFNMMSNYHVEVHFMNI